MAVKTHKLTLHYDVRDKNGQIAKYTNPDHPRLGEEMIDVVDIKLQHLFGIATSTGTSPGA